MRVGASFQGPLLALPKRVLFFCAVALVGPARIVGVMNISSSCLSSRRTVRRNSRPISGMAARKGRFRFGVVFILLKNTAQYQGLSIIHQHLGFYGICVYRGDAVKNLPHSILLHIQLHNNALIWGDLRHYAQTQHRILKSGRRRPATTGLLKRNIYPAIPIAMTAKHVSNNFRRLGFLPP